MVNLLSFISLEVLRYIVQLTIICALTFVQSIHKRTKRIDMQIHSLSVYQSHIAMALKLIKRAGSVKAVVMAT